MTQEELDALISGGVDDMSEPEEIIAPTKETLAEEEEPKTSANKGASAMDNWPPPPPTQEHQVVNQLDDVTKDSEIKATEIMDKLEIVSEQIADMEDTLGKLSDKVVVNIAMFDKLLIKFPNVESFKQAQEDNISSREDIDNLLTKCMDSGDEVLGIMDIMQYQDIHRQKIERVVNVMRALAGYMNNLFATSVDDTKRVGSAVHIAGDDNQDAISTDDLEELISKLGK